MAAKGRQAQDARLLPKQSPGKKIAAAMAAEATSRTTHLDLAVATGTRRCNGSA